MWCHRHCGERPRKKTTEKRNTAWYRDKHKSQRYHRNYNAREKTPPSETDPHLNRKKKPSGATTQKNYSEDHGRRSARSGLHICRTQVAQGVSDTRSPNAKQVCV